MQEDTRQDPANRPGLVDQEPDDVEDNTTIEDCVGDLQSLILQRSALENYRDQFKSAGVDGLDHLASQIMLINLTHLKGHSGGYGMESFDPYTDTITLEDFSEWVNNLSQRIKELIAKLIEKAKQYASRIMTGVDKVKANAEEMLDRANGRRDRASNELHDEDKIIDIDSPEIIWADGKLCLGDCKSEQEVIKFFVQTWPKYAEDQVTRAKRMISEYDIESGNSENFEANAGFIGNHESLVATITKVILPGNKAIAFKYKALGPELVSAEDATPAPAKIQHRVRSLAEIKHSLKTNVGTMNVLGSMFRSEAAVLNAMSSLSDAVMELESRRNETVWKSARQGLDDITKTMMDIVTRLKPNYDPIVRHLAKVGAARNAICNRELDALGQ